MFIEIQLEHLLRFQMTVHSVHCHKAEKATPPSHGAKSVESKGASPKKLQHPFGHKPFCFKILRAVVSIEGWMKVKQVPLTP